MMMTSSSAVCRRRWLDVFQRHTSRPPPPPPQQLHYHHRRNHSTTSPFNNNNSNNSNSSDTTHHHHHHNSRQYDKKARYVLPYEYFLPEPTKPAGGKLHDVRVREMEEGPEDVGDVAVRKQNERLAARRKQEETEALGRAGSLAAIADVFVTRHADSESLSERLARMKDRMETVHLSPLTPTESREMEWYADELLKMYDNPDDTEMARVTVSSLFSMPRHTYTRTAELEAMPLDVDAFFRGGRGRKRSLALWNELLDVHSYKGTLASVRAVLSRMELEGWVPNVTSYAALMRTAGRLRQREMAFNIFTEMEAVAGITADIQCFAALMYAAARTGRWAKCYEVLDMARAREMVITEDVYYPLLKGMHDARLYEKVEEVFNEMFQEETIIPTAPTYALMMRNAGHLKLPERAEVHMEHMRHLEPAVDMDMELYNAMIFACAMRTDTYDKAFEYLDQMVQLKLVPNHDTFHGLLLACESNNDLNTGERVLKMMDDFKLPRTLATKLAVLKVIASSQRFVAHTVADVRLTQTDRCQLALDILKDIHPKDVTPYVLQQVLRCYTTPCHVQSALTFFNEAYAHYHLAPNRGARSDLFRMATRTRDIRLAEQVKRMIEARGGGGGGGALTLGQFRQLLYLYGKYGQFSSGRALLDEMTRRGLSDGVPDNERLFAIGEPVVLQDLWQRRRTHFKTSARRRTPVSALPSIPFNNGRPKHEQREPLFAVERVQRDNEPGNVSEAVDW